MINLAVDYVENRDFTFSPNSPDITHQIPLLSTPQKRRQMHRVDMARMLVTHMDISTVARNYEPLSYPIFLSALVWEREVIAAL
jgi:hypothetical protein